MLKTLFRGYWMYVSCGFLLLIPFCILSFFTYPQADDLCVGSFVAENGFVHAQSYLFSYVNSRFVSSFLISFFVSNGLLLYRIGILLSMLLFFVSVLVFSLRVFQNRKQALLMSMTFILLTFNMFPDSSEVIFWMSGAFTYLFAMSLIFLFGSVCRIFSSGHICNMKQFAIMFVLMLLIAGTHELALLAVLAICSYILFFVKTDKSQKIMMLTLIVSGIAFIAFLFFMGASSSRADYYEHIPFATVIAHSMTSLLKLFVLVFTSFPFLLSVFAVVLFASPSDKFANVLKGKFILSIVFIFIAMFLLIVVPVAATGLVPPLRVYSFLLVIFIPVVLLNVYVARIRFFSSYRFSRAHKLFLGRLLGIVFIVALLGGFHKVPGGKFVFTGNIPAAISDVAFNAIPYANQMNERIQLIEEAVASNKDTLVLPKISHKPINLFFLDIDDEYPVWIRYCFQHYYNYHGVVVVK